MVRLFLAIVEHLVLICGYAESDEEIRDRLANYEGHIAQQKTKLASKKREYQDYEENIGQMRKEHVSAMLSHSELMNEAKVHEKNVAEREALIREVSNQYKLKGYEHSQMENAKVEEFLGRLDSMRTRQNAETEKLQVLEF